MAEDALMVTDLRTGKQYRLAIEGGTIRAADLAKIRATPSGAGLASYDPALRNTAVCKSRVTYVDGGAGALLYRGYPIEELVEKSTFVETAYLVVKGELPDGERLRAWEQNIRVHTMVHENVKKFMDGFRYDAHPMGMLVGTVGALSTFYTDGRNILDLESRRLQTRRLIGKLPTLAAFAYRRSNGMPYIYPDHDLGYVANFLSMVFKMSERRYVPDPLVERSLEVMFILHADHEQNCSTTALRCVASAHSDPYSAVAAAIAALHGPRHAGAHEETVRMFEEIGSVKRVPEALRQVKSGERRLYGFGHPVYTTLDPRARIMKELAQTVMEARGGTPLLEVALEIERIAMEDGYFVSRKLCPTLDFYSGLVYQSLGFPPSMFPVLYAIARTAGWMAHWAELVRDPEQEIVRPRQLYVGAAPRAYVPIEERPEPEMREDAVSPTI